MQEEEKPQPLTLNNLIDNLMEDIMKPIPEHLKAYNYLKTSAPAVLADEIDYSDYDEDKPIPEREPINFDDYGDDVD